MVMLKTTCDREDHKRSRYVTLLMLAKLLDLYKPCCYKYRNWFEEFEWLSCAWLHSGAKLDSPCFSMVMWRHTSPLYKAYYYSFKIFLRFWLAKLPLIIHHNQLLSTKFGRILRYVNWWRQSCSKIARLLNGYPRRPVDEVELFR